jgi:hypothetical protein
MKHTFSSGRVSEVHNISSSSGRWLWGQTLKTWQMLFIYPDNVQWKY